MTVIGLAALGLIVLALCFGAYVRLAPDDLARWHIDISTDKVAAAGLCGDQIITATNSARTVCLSSTPAPELLTRLDRIAKAAPRTTLLAGDAASGRITWITRSLLWGFPDYTTAQASQTSQGTRLEIFARLRYGETDMGVNAARLRDWLNQF